MQVLETEVVIVGGGPGGAMLGMLLARKGVNVILVERTRKLDREFRGESISPDSVAILHEFNIIKDIEAHGYLETKKMQVFDKTKKLLEVNFEKFDFPKKFSIDVPQPVLISAILKEACKFQNFLYFNGTHCESLINNKNKISGIICRKEDELIQINSRLVVGADGRYGKVRKLANLPAAIQPLQRDVLWFMLPMPKSWGSTAKLFMDKNNHIIALPTYPDTLRVGLNIKTGKYNQIRQNSISYLHQMVSQLAPELESSVKEKIKKWSDLSLLDIFTMEVPQKCLDGLILIGDAAHTLTPILGQGVNQAIKDAVFIFPVIQLALKNQSGILFKSNFKKYLKIRRAEVKRVHGFQVRQERLISLSSFVGTSFRSALYRFMNISFLFQKILWGKILYQYQKSKQAV